MTVRSLHRTVGALALVLALQGCAGDAPPEAGSTEGTGGAVAEPAASADTPGDTTPGAAVSRETFIESYVALRYQAVQSPANDLDPADRARILQEHGVTEEELLAFVEAHGEDPTYMESVWSEVETRMDALQEPGRARPDSGTDAGAAGTG